MKRTLRFFAETALFLGTIFTGVILEWPAALTLFLALCPFAVILLYELRQVNRQVNEATKAEAKVSMARNAAGLRAAREERTLDHDGDVRLIVIGNRHLVLDDPRRTPARIALTTPDDALYVVAEVGPIEPHLQPNGRAFSREVVSGSLDAAADRAHAVFRVTVWESRYIPGHWEYSHQYLQRSEWDATTGSYLGSSTEEPPSPE